MMEGAAMLNFMIGTGIRAIAKHIKGVNWYYKNNGFIGNRFSGCCRAQYYDFIQASQTSPTELMTSIESTYPVSLTDFTSNTNCQILRDNFTTYDEYFDSMMVKFPCSAGGTIAEFPSGKADTYKLADCTFLDNAKGKQEVLYPAAHWAASIDLNAPKLGKGNWWLPSTAEMAEIWRDITYGTSFWKTKPDIINQVLKKLNPAEISMKGEWSMFHADWDAPWTSSKFDNSGNAYYYLGRDGDLYASFVGYTANAAIPITIYEF